MRRRNHSFGPSAREGGWSLIELTVTLFLLMAIALFGLKTMVAGFLQFYMQAPNNAPTS